MSPAKKFRMTRQRKLILEELRKVNSHPTADELYQLVQRRLPKISLGTVYRNLEILSQADIIQKLELGGTQRRFDGKIENHYHIRCMHCGRVEDLLLKPLAPIEEEISRASDYQIIGYRLEFIGICPRCKKGQSNLQRDKRN